MVTDGGILVRELHRLGIKTLRENAQVTAPFIPIDAVELLISLSEHQDARLRSALIPLFVHSPHYSNFIQQALADCSKQGAIVLRCFYAAAQILQSQHILTFEQFGYKEPKLPSIFHKELGFNTSDDVSTQLRHLAIQQRKLSKCAINWKGTYEHAYQMYARTIANPVA